MTHKDEKHKKGSAASIQAHESALFPSIKGQVVSEIAFAEDPEGRRDENYGATETNFSARLYQSHYEDRNPWEKELKGQGEPIADSFLGRVGIRSISRGIMGTAAMTWAELEMRDYDPGLLRDVKEGIKENRIAKEELGKFSRAHRFFDATANLFDNTIGQAIKYGIAHPYAGIAGISKEQAEHDILHFRTKANYSAYNIEKTRPLFKAYNGQEITRDTVRPQDANTLNIRKINGRSLGQEMVDTTFSFAMGSIGDALGRNLVGVLDPNVKKDWLDDKGFHPIKLLKNTRDSVWDILSYRQMEDWVVALPYVYTMKAMRPIHAKISPNSKVSIDSNYGVVGTISKDGASYVGDTALTAALNLQLRFSIYNFYTLMFRDAYHQAAHNYVNWKQHGFSMSSPDVQQPPSTLEEKVTNAINYVGTSFIKSQTWMTPAVLFFWPQRLACTKINGRLASEQTGGMLTDKAATPPTPEADGRVYFAQKDMIVSKGLGNYTIKDGKVHYRTPEEMKEFRNEFGWNPVTRSSTSRPWKENGSVKTFLLDKDITTATTTGEDALSFRRYDPIKNRVGVSLLSNMMNPFARFARDVQNGLEDHVLSHIQVQTDAERGNRAKSWLEERLTQSGAQIEGGSYLQRYLNSPNFLAGRLVSNSLSYTPYMIAKAELENKVNTVEADASLYRMLEGIEHFNRKEASAGFMDYINSIVQHPVSDLTKQRIYEGKGLVNSMQRTKDLAHQHQDHNSPTFAEIVDKEHALGLHAKQPVRKPLTTEEEKNAEAIAREAITKARVTSKAAALPTEKTFPLDGDQGRSKREAFITEERAHHGDNMTHLARLQQQHEHLKGAPDGVTLH